MYCPEHSTEELSREHVIPKGLGGGVILLKSSCEKCRVKTCKIEEECLTKNWKLFRVQNNLDLSDPKSAPTTGAIIIRQDGKLLTKMVPLEDRPNYLTMPIPDAAPGLLTGRSQETGIRLMHFYDRKDALAKALKHPGFVSTSALFNSGAVFQFLAKIAHGMMYVSFETSDVTPLLEKIILSDYLPEHWWRYIGLAPDIEAEVLPPQWWGAHHMKCFSARIGGGLHIIATDIRLFASIVGAEINSPTYRVIAGITRQEPIRSSWKPLGFQKVVSDPLNAT
ncbi:MAG TPA: hypothetical protein VMF58_03620 [Rhizomicrobium sp.]|nr:hypothetical protein [Rhizomicrobium sp.]